MQYNNIKQQYLSFKNPNSKILAVRSGKGTGKTRWLEDNLQGEGKVLFITHRVALGTSISKRMNAGFYKNRSELDSGRLVISFDSLPLLAGNDIYKGATIVIDEAVQALRHFFGDTCKAERQLIYNTLSYLVYHCKQLILMDADLIEEVIEFFVGLTETQKEEVSWVENSWVVQGKKFIEYPSIDSIVANITKDIKAGIKVFVASDTASRVGQLYSVISKLIDQDKIILINSETSKSEKQSAFINNVNEQQKLYQVALSSPSLCTGIDISEEHFEKVYLIADNYYLTGTDLLQSAARVRKVKEISFWVETKLRYNDTKWEKIIKELGAVFYHANTKDIDIVRSYLKGDLWARKFNKVTGKYEIVDRPFVELMCKLKAMENNSLNNLRDSFIESAKKEGVVVECKSVDARKKEGLIEKLLKEEGKKIKESKKQAILAAATIPKESYDLYRSVEGLSKEEEIEVERFRLLELVGGIEDLLEYAIDNEEELWKTVELQGYIRESKEDLEQKDSKDKEQKMLTDCKNRARQKELIESFLKNIEYQNAIGNGGNIKADFSVVLWAQAYTIEIKHYFGITVTKDVKDKPMQLVQAMLKILGIKLEGIQKKRDGTKTRIYFINKDSLNKVNRIMEAREQKQREWKEQRELAESPFS